MRLIERLQQTQPILCGRGGEHVGVPGVHRGDTGRGECAVAGPGVLVGFHDDGDIAGLQRAAGEGGAAGEQCADIGGQVAADVLAQAIDADGAGALAAAGHHPQPERIVARCAGQPVSLMMRGDVVHDDSRPAELRATQHHLQPLHQGGVAAPVDAEGLLVPCGLGGPQVGVDIAAAEGVDGLFGIADQDQRRLPGERPLDHLPLHRVGVLELVDHHHRPALRHPDPGRRFGVGQRIGEPGQQIVIAQHAAAALTDLQLLQHIPCEAQAFGGEGVRVGIGRAELSRRVAHHLGRQFAGVAVAQPGCVGVIAEPGQVQVVDNLGHQLVEAFHQGDAAVAVTGHSERFQHDVAELVCRRDGGAVEPCQRVT